MRLHVAHDAGRRTGARGQRRLRPQKQLLLVRRKHAGLQQRTAVERMRRLLLLLIL